MLSLEVFIALSLLYWLIIYCDCHFSQAHLRFRLAQCLLIFLGFGAIFRAVSLAAGFFSVVRELSYTLKWVSFSIASIFSSPAAFGDISKSPGLALCLRRHLLCICYIKIWMFDCGGSITSLITELFSPNIIRRRYYAHTCLAPLEPILRRSAPHRRAASNDLKRPTGWLHFSAHFGAILFGRRTWRIRLSLYCSFAASAFSTEALMPVIMTINGVSHIREENSFLTATLHAFTQLRPNLINYDI